MSDGKWDGQQPKMLYKTANKTTTFIIEAQFGHKKQENGGKVVEINKLIFVLIKRDADNNAVMTLRFWQDIYKSFHLMKMIQDGSMLKFKEQGDELVPRYKLYEYKKTPKMHRIFNVEPVVAAGKDGGKSKKLRFKVEERLPGKDDDRKYLYFDIDFDEAVAMAHWVYKNIDYYYQSQYFAETLRDSKKNK